MTKKKLVLVLLSVVMMLSVFAACSGNNNNTSSTPSNSSNTNANSGANEVKEEPPLEKVTFTYFNAGAQVKDVNLNETEIGKIIEEKTGVNWKIEYPVGDVPTKIGTLIASNSYPDVLSPDTQIDKILEAGAFIPLNDLIEEHGPNIKRVYGQYFNLMKQADGNIYFLPYSPIVGDFLPNPNIEQGAFWIQRRVLKEAGYPKIKTLDEYMQLIIDYANKHKDENLTGFISLTDDWRFFATTNPPNHLLGFPNDGEVMVDLNTLDATVYGNHESTKRWLKKLNDLNAMGLFDKSSFVDNYDQYTAKLVSGKVLGYFDYGWQVNEPNQALKAAGNPDLEFFPLPIVFDSDIKDQYLDPPAFVDNRGIGITVSAKDPVRIIQYFNELLTDEMQTLVRWGIPGRTYEIDDNGRFYRTNEQIDMLRDSTNREAIGLRYLEYYWPMYGNGSTLADGNSVDPGRQPEVAQASFTADDIDILSKYGVKTYAEMFAAPDDRPWYPAWSISLEQGSAAQIYTVKKQDLQRKYVARLVMAAPDKFEAEWDAYINEYNQLDVKLYEDTMTQLIKEKVAKVKGN